MNRYNLKKYLSLLSGALFYQWRNVRQGLYVFNYHRIGDSTANDFDPNVFSCDTFNFKKHLQVIQSRFEIINLDTLIEIIDNDLMIEKPLALITFDDGYIDNYDIAFPLLKEAGISAVFFLPTSYVGNNGIPWWDEIAWMVKKTSLREIKLPDWSDPVVLSHSDIDRSIRLVLKNIKKVTTVPIPEKLKSLRNLLGCECPDVSKDPLFVNWDQVREMYANGMNIGSHTHSHLILSHLSVENQLIELIKSRKILEKELGADIVSIAYPVGKAESYTASTLSLCEQAGYKVAFSFIHGYNPSPNLKCFELLRMPVDGNGNAIDLKYLASFAPKEWRS